MFCENIHTGGVYLDPSVSGCFLFCLFFLINIDIMSHEIANVVNSFSQILHFISSSLHIFPLQYMSWSVSCFYVLSAYPCSYNSDHTNNTYVIVVLETGQSFLNEGNQCVL